MSSGPTAVRRTLWTVQTLEGDAIIGLTRYAGLQRPLASQFSPESIISTSWDPPSVGACCHGWSVSKTTETGTDDLVHDESSDLNLI